MYTFLQNRMPDQYRRAFIDLIIETSIRTHHIGPFGPPEAEVGGPLYRLGCPSLRVGKKGFAQAVKLEKLASENPQPDITCLIYLMNDMKIID